MEEKESLTNPKFPDILKNHPREGKEKPCAKAHGRALSVGGLGRYNIYIACLIATISEKHTNVIGLSLAFWAKNDFAKQIIFNGSKTQFVVTGKLMVCNTVFSLR